MLELGKQTKGRVRKSAGRNRAGEVANLLLEVVPGLMRELRQEARGSRGGALTIPQFRILAHLGCRLATTNKSLAESVGVSVPATSRMVDLLVKRGLVVRTHSPADKREISLSLTPKGTQEFEGIRLLMKGKIRARLETLPSERLFQAEAGLKALASVLTHLRSSRQ